MEGDHENEGISTVTAGGGPGSSRWNPTKEQISMLESLYKQGIRTPSAEQIQQITSRLKAYGHIEGKNVFYWFQNHKARQRQKQKQENVAYFNRYFQITPPVFYPRCPNVVCGPYHRAQSDIGFFPQCPNVPLPSGIKRKPVPVPQPQELENATAHGVAVYELSHVQGYNMMAHKDNNSNCGLTNPNQETLPLFPLHPTGNLHERTDESCATPNPSCSLENGCATSYPGGMGQQPFFDFFSGNGSCESD